MIGLNVRSLVSKYEQIEAILDDGRIDVLSLNESWLNNNISNNLIRIEGYKIYRLDRAMRRKGGGLCVYVHGKYKVNAQVHEDLNVSDKDLELLVLVIELKCTTPYILMSVYRPPQGNQTQFVEKLGEALERLGRTDGGKIIVVGDVNIDVMHKQETKIMKDLKLLQQEYSLRQIITTPTRVTSSGQTLIDHIYTNVSCDMIADTGVLENAMSDHNPVYCLIKKPKLKYEKVSFTCRSMKNYSYDDILNELQQADWTRFWTSMDISEAWYLMYNTYLEVLDKLCPEVTHENVPKKSEWLTAAIFELMRTRDRLFRKAKVTKSDDDWDEAKGVRNSTNETCKNAKNEYVKSKLIQDEGNPKKFWGHLKPLLNEGNSKNDKSMIELEGHSHNNVPDVFNEYFAGIGIKLSKQIRDLNPSEHAQLADKQKVNNPNNHQPHQFKWT